MTAGKRIGLNVTATYGRSLVALVCGLISARWVLAALGASDFGLYAIVGSALALAWYLGDLLRISVARHFAFAAGGEGVEGQRTWFASACAVHVVFALTLLILAWPIGEMLVRRVIVIPDGRFEAALWVLRLAVASLVFTIASLPFSAMFTAHQRFASLAVFGCIRSLFLLGCAAILRTWNGDRLVAYGAYMAVGLMGEQLVQALWALVVFPACRMGKGWKVDSIKIRHILTFAGWNTFGGGGYLVSIHGSNFVTNLNFGSVANAAYGIAQSVQTHVEALSNALVGAFEPAVIGACGAGDRNGMKRLATRAGVLGTFLLALFMVPLTLEIKTVLGLWLGSPPDGAAQVTRIVLWAVLVDKMTMGQQLAIAADGRIALLQIVSGGVSVLAIPAAVVLVGFDGGLEAAAWAFGGSLAVRALVKVWQGHCVVGMAAGDWLRRTVLPLGVLLAVAVGAGLLPRLGMAAGFGRVVVTSLVTTAVFAIGGWALVRRTS